MQVPAWYEGELPPALAARPEDFESEGTRIPGPMLKHGGAFATADPRAVAVPPSSKL